MFYNFIMDSIRLTNEDGSIYEGKILDSKFHGKGKITYPDGNVKEGLWYRGKFIGNESHLHIDIFKKPKKVNKIIKYKEFEKINCISYTSTSCWTGKEHRYKIINNEDKIIYEYYENGELKKSLGIEHEIWKTLINKLFKIIKQRNYYWNKNYYVNGDERVFDVSPWKMEIKNNTNECIEINCKGKAPEIFLKFLEIIWDIYYDKIENKKE